MDKLKDWWTTLEPGKQKLVLIGGALTIGLVLLVLMSGNGRERKERATRTEKPETTILGSDRGEADMAQLNAKVKTLEDQLKVVTRDREEQATRISRLQGAIGSLTQLQQNPEQIANLLDEQARLRADLDLLQSGTGVRSGVPGVSADGGGADPFGKATTAASDLLDPLEKVKAPRGRAAAGPADVEEELPQIQIDGKTSAERRGSSGGPQPRRTAGDATQSSRDRRGAELTQQPDSVYLPAGSLFQGVLLNGMDAPTGRGATSQPYPVTIRLTSLAFLPNRFSTNVRECFVIAAGVGRLDDERVHLRTERLSCVNQGGQIIDIALEGYITGEDGKVGLRGTVVERTGALLARSALAGLASGLSTALTPQWRRSVQTGDDAGGVSFEAPDTGEVLEVAAYQGAADAMERIADFYMARADEIFPIIELDAMRQLTVHLTRGATLKLMESATWGNLADTKR
jgi:conjugal transfer pilus assembly protein TraB